MNNATDYDAFKDIAIIGMAGRFPGAKNLEEFWQNLQDGVESVNSFNDAELIAAGVDKNLINDPNYVKAGAILEDVDLFDAPFFDFNPKEAENTDPQHRLFLECAWSALENAGYDSSRCESRIGVYAGAALNTYLALNTDNDPIGSVSSFQKLIGNDKDFLSTRVSYKLNLSGPSITVQTACSTSLVAIALAYQSLLNYQCDMALAGGISIIVPEKTGYLYQEGGILSKDGHCRAFDAKASGTIVGNGVGVVVLKRLADAIADGDCIHAIIKGVAINNDGANKVGYTAPSVDGQVEVVSEALTLAGVDPETITYIEAHGTGTSLGDPIELAALTNVFRDSTEKKGFCAIGSLKTNIGHLNTAAGVAGLIKTVLALQHKLIPPSLNFAQPNPQIDFTNSPFYVNTQLQAWQPGKTPRRAGVSSFGFGGTNAHVILEEAPTGKKQGSKGAGEQGRKHQLLVVSAKTRSALETATANLAKYLNQHPEIDLADVAYTLQVGRREFNHRCMVVCKDIKDAATLLESQPVFAHCQENIKRSIVFMFPGQGSQYANMARELYESEPVFREQIDDCAELLQPLLGRDLRHILYPDVEDTEEFTEKLQQTAIAQPALFAIEYALAKLWMEWGVHPKAMIGHSIGEYVAACLAGVFSLEDALALVAARAQLMQQLPGGTMLVVHLTEKECQTLLNPELSLAAVNGPSLCVVSGSTAAIDVLENQLVSAGVECQRLHTSHAFHSSMMNPILDSFTQRVKKIRLNPPQIPYLSNVTGTWITAAQATDPSYWSKHLRSTVRFADGLFELMKEPANILLEVGPGRTLSTLAKRHPERAAEQVILSSVRHPQQNDSDVAFLLNALGQLWLAGVQVDWLGFYSHQERHRLPLPTYPFERQRYWIQASLPSKNLVKVTSEIEWQPMVLQRRLVDYLLSPMAISQRLVAQLPELISQTDSKIFNQLLVQIEANSVAYVLQAFQKMGWQFQVGERFSVAEVAKKLGVVSKYQQLLGRVLEMLAQEGMLLPIGDGWEAIKEQQILDPQEMMNNLLDQYPDNVGELSLLQRCGINLADVLQGDCDPLELLHPKVYDRAANQRLQESPINKIMQTLVQRAVELALEQCQGEKQSTLRVIEIGAGTGLTTSYVLPILNPATTEYVYTDISSFFTAKAQDKFRDYPFVRYQLLDIEQDPLSQGFGLHQFDLVIAANVLHATQDLHQTLHHVRQLLAPGGMLVLLELTSRLGFVDLTFGLTEGWWRFTDYDLRPDYPLLSSAKWLKLLQESGFSKAATIAPQTNYRGIDDYQAVIVAQSMMPSVAGRNWLILCDAEGRGQQLAALLTSQGDVCAQVFPGEKYEQLAELEFSIDSTNPTDWQRIFESLPTPLYGIIHLWSLNAAGAEISTVRDLEKTVEIAYRSASGLVQWVLNSTFSQSLGLWLVTRGTQPVEIEPNILGLAQSRLWKMGNAIALEHPELNCIRVDLDPERIGDEAEYLFQEINSDSRTDQVAFRGQIRYVARQIAPSQSEKDAARLAVATSDRRELNLTEVVRYDSNDKSVISLIIEQVSQLLGVAADQIDIEQPLSNLGLDSLVVIELRKRLSNELKVDVPLASFLDGSSIAKLENQIKEAIASFSGVETSKASPSLVALQPSGSEPPLFCIHPVAGVVFPYYELACQLGEKQPVYGLQSVGFGDDEQPLTSIEEMAERYIQDLRAVQPTGPYRLVAWSFGAIVAFEMAVQLEQAGEKVDLLAVIDTPPPSANKIGSVFLALKFVSMSLLPYIWPYVYDYLELSLAALHQSKPRNLVQRVGKKLWELTQSKLKYRQAPRSELVMKYRQPNVNRLLRVILKNFIASGDYVPSVYAEKIHLFRTNEKLWEVERDNTLGWSNFAKGGVEIHQIPGHHLSVLRTPNVQVVAQKLKACLNHVHSQTKKKRNW
ncbi:type I polyketide synthase [Microseira wollei]|uniref:Beta-ketoacyl synthase n=1 Tax=Microseira wollei NIES-4236 TaxID=2530354 RepID=A0AAV3XBR0_9CYAN|nr:type I polyketide synthase [Microseira wollei]GET39923.1 beta-ketoacyl synthase [Microseira wollei NIES-4236]